MSLKMILLSSSARDLEHVLENDTFVLFCMRIQFFDGKTCLSVYAYTWMPSLSFLKRRIYFLDWAYTWMPCGWDLKFLKDSGLFGLPSFFPKVFLKFLLNLRPFSLYYLISDKRIFDAICHAIQCLFHVWLCINEMFEH